MINIKEYDGTYFIINPDNSVAPISELAYLAIHAQNEKIKKYELILKKENKTKQYLNEWKFQDENTESLKEWNSLTVQERQMITEVFPQFGYVDFEVTKHFLKRPEELNFVERVVKNRYIPTKKLLKLEQQYPLCEIINNQPIKDFDDLKGENP